MSFNCSCSFVPPCSCKATQSETLPLSNGLSFHRWLHIPSWVSPTPVPSEPTHSPRDSLRSPRATLTSLLIHLLVQAASPALSLSPHWEPPQHQLFKLPWASSEHDSAFQASELLQRRRNGDKRGPWTLTPRCESAHSKLRDTQSPLTLNRSSLVFFAL